MRLRESPVQRGIAIRGDPAPDQRPSPRIPHIRVGDGIQCRQRGQGIVAKPGVGDTPQCLRSSLSCLHRQRILPGALRVHPGLDACPHLLQVGFHGEPERDPLLAAFAQVFAPANDVHGRLVSERRFERLEERQCRIKVVASPHNQGMHQLDRAITLLGEKPCHGRSWRKLYVARIDYRPQRSAVVRKAVCLREQFFHCPHVRRSQQVVHRGNPVEPAWHFTDFRHGDGARTRHRWLRR